MQGKAKVLEALITAQTGRMILWLPVMLGAGSALYFSLLAEPPGIITAAIVAAVVLAVGLAWPWRAGTDGRRAVWVGLLLLLWLVTGFALAQGRTARLAGPILTKDIRVTAIEGTVAAVEILPGETGQRVVLQDLRIEKLAAEDTPRRVRLRIRDGDVVPVGARVKTLGALTVPSAPVMPGAFDFQRFAYFKQIGAFGYTFRPLEITAPPGAGEGLRIHTARVRQHIVARVKEHLPPMPAAFAAALMVGERSSINPADNEAMRVSGLAHMLVISGMHVGMIAAAVFFAVRLILAAIPAVALRYPIKKYAAFAGLLAAAFYTGLAVPTVPSYRALVMCAFVLIAVMIDRKPFSMRTIALAATAVLLVTPEAIWSASFQMSFAAAAALIFFFEETAPWWMKWRRQAGLIRRGFLYVAGVCATTLVASMATAPFAAYHFNQYAVYSLLANLLAVPVLSFVVMPLIVISFIALAVGGEGPVLWAMGKGIETIVRIAHDVAALPVAQIIVPAWPVAAMALIAISGVLLMIWAGRSRWVLAGVCMLAAIAAIAAYKPPDVIVAGDGRLMAWRGNDGTLALSSARHDKFAGGIWLRRNGQHETAGQYWPREGTGPGGIICDAAGCRGERNGRKVSFLFGPEGAAEDCAWADIVVSRSPLRRRDCGAALTVDRFDMWRNGAYAVWLDDMRVENVAARRGQRPWMAVNRR